MYSLNNYFSSGRTTVPLRTKAHLANPQYHTQEALFALSGLPKRLPKSYSLLILLLVADPRWAECGYCWRHHELQTPCSSDIGYRVPWAGSDLRASSLRTSFYGPEGTMQTFKEGRQFTILLSYDVSEPQQWLACYLNGTGVPHISWQS